MKHIFHFDTAPFPGNLKSALFTDVDDVTPEQAAEVMFSEKGEAAAARQRMIARHARGTHSSSADEGRQRMIDRGGAK